MKLLTFPAHLVTEAIIEGRTLCHSGTAEPTRTFTDKVNTAV